MPTKIFLNQPLIFMTLYEHAKNQTILLCCSRDIVDLKIPQYFGLWNYVFPEIWDCAEIKQSPVAIT